MTVYRVASTRVNVGGVRYRRGALVDVPEDEAERLLKLGAIELQGPADDAERTPEPASAADGPEPETAEPGPGLERPRQAAAKSLWVDYAVARGLDRAEVEEMDKREIIAAVS